MFQIIFLILVLFIFFLLYVKAKIEVTIGDKIFIDIVLLKLIKLKRFEFNEDELKKMGEVSKNVVKEEVENYLKNIKYTDAKFLLKSFKQLFALLEFEKIDFDLNINVDDYILNAYIITLANTVIAMLISANIKKINTENLNYVITSNEKEIKLNLKCIMYGKVANIILVIRKLVYYAYKLKKRGNDKNGKGTSDRKSNGNSNDIARVND